MKARDHLWQGAIIGGLVLSLLAVLVVWKPRMSGTAVFVLTGLAVIATLHLGRAYYRWGDDDHGGAGGS